MGWMIDFLTTHKKIKGSNILSHNFGSRIQLKLTFIFYFHNACFLTEARNHLRRMREDQVRDGQTVVSLWEDVLMSERNKLGDECKRLLNKEQWWWWLGWNAIWKIKEVLKKHSLYTLYNYFFILHLFLLCMHYLFLVWTVYEQVCIAALDCQRIDISEVNT